MVTQKEIFYQYLLNERARLEKEVAQLRQALRMREVDAVDCLELALAMERLNSFVDFASKSMSIFDFNIPADYNTITFDFTPYKKLAALEKKNQRETLAERAEHRSKVRNISYEQAFAELQQIDEMLKRCREIEKKQTKKQ